MKKLSGFKWFLAIIVISFIFTVGCNQKNPTSINNDSPIFESEIHQDMTNVIHTIESTFILDGVKVNSNCTSFHIGDGYILTCKHGVIITSKLVRTPFGTAMVLVNGQDYKYKMDGEPIELLGYVADVALFYNSNLINTPKVEIIDSNLLKLGDKLMVVGNSGMRGINIKIGVLSKLELNEPLLGFPANTAKSTFVLAAPINFGDSGSPIFVIDKDTKKYYMIGMVYAGVPSSQGYNFGIKSNYILDVIKQINNLNTLPNIGR